MDEAEKLVKMKLELKQESHVGDHRMFAIEGIPDTKYARFKRNKDDHTSFYIEGMEKNDAVENVFITLGGIKNQKKADKLLQEIMETIVKEEITWELPK